jgi:hypothetical protein
MLIALGGKALRVASHEDHQHGANAPPSCDDTAKCTASDTAEYTDEYM